MKTTDILLLMRGVEKLYDRCMEPLREHYGLTHMEIKIISFLNNNPGRDTAADISNLRMLPKGNVSQGVESLIQKGLLNRTPDKKDRRKIHLGFTENADAMILDINQARRQYQKILLQGLSKEQLEVFEQVNERISKNVFTCLERRADDAE